MAFYPGPAGVAESELGLAAWTDVLEANPELGVLSDDVEALLVRGADHDHKAQCFLVPIDACYELAGRLRSVWRGFDGGQDARAVIEDFFATVAARSRRADPGFGRVIDLAFRIDDIVCEPYAAVPQLTARLEISERSGEKIHALALRCQVRIEPSAAPMTRKRLPDSPTSSDRAIARHRLSSRFSGCTARPWSQDLATRRSLTSHAGDLRP